MIPPKMEKNSTMYGICTPIFIIRGRMMLSTVEIMKIPQISKKMADFMLWVINR
jgi:hypothetical protein